jgi:hypothetical protein
MLPDELITFIKRLPLDEKMALLAALTRTVNEELRQESRDNAVDPRAKRALELLETDGPLPSFAELQGILATDTPIPAEYDWEDDYADYLTKKYA